MWNWKTCDDNRGKNIINKKYSNQKKTWSSTGRNDHWSSVIMSCKESLWSPKSSSAPQLMSSFNHSFTGVKDTLALVFIGHGSDTIDDFQSIFLSWYARYQTVDRRRDCRLTSLLLTSLFIQRSVHCIELYFPLSDVLSVLRKYFIRLSGQDSSVGIWICIP